MNLKQLFVAVPAALLILGNGAANAGQTIDRVGAIACVNDKWTESEPEKGHKLAESCPTMRVDPERRGRGEGYARLRWKIRVHARRELEGQRHLH